MAWARFFIDMLRVQKISPGYREIVEKSHPMKFSFLVKEWEFKEPGSSPETTPYKYILGNTQDVKNIVNITRGQGQGNNDPLPHFLNHFVVKYGGLFYDPSYGTGPFGDDQQWENMSIDGTFYDIEDDSGDVVKSLVKKNDLVLTEIKFRWKLYW